MKPLGGWVKSLQERLKGVNEEVVPGDVDGEDCGRDGLGQGGRLILEAEQEITSGCEVTVREYVEPDSIDSYDLSLCSEPEGEVCETYFVDDGGDLTVVF